MKFNILGYTIRITKQGLESELIEKVDQQIDATLPNENMGNIQIKIKRIMTLRKIVSDSPTLYPELYAGGLVSQKLFVEKHWQ